MNQLNMAEIFSTPLEYQPPVEGDLQHDSFYPNLNSLEYMKKAPDFNLKLQKFYESIDINSDGHAALGCNDYTSRIWNGSLWGFDKIDDVGIADHAAYKLQCASTITDLKFAEKNIVNNSSLINFTISFNVFFLILDFTIRNKWIITSMVNLF